MTKVKVERAAVGAALFALTTVLVACSATDISAEDSRIITELQEIASNDLDLDSNDSTTTCWLPSKNIVAESTFRVLCRVSFKEESEDRHKDMICIGNPKENPVTEYCYEWAHYSDMPAYEDQPGYAPNR